jgi:hypothetical protein
MFFVDFQEEFHLCGGIMQRQNMVTFHTVVEFTYVKIFEFRVSSVIPGRSFKHFFKNKYSFFSRIDISNLELKSQNVICIKK